jgi:molybdopterin-guanine dinucleotide biosynthesis protein B
MPNVISIVGLSNSGKTTFIEKLIPELRCRGYKIGVIKHSHHAVDIDREGKDSWKYQKAGAETVMVASSGKLAMVKTSSDEIPLEEVLTYFSDMDLVITEGYKKENKPKIEIFRKEKHKQPACSKKDNLIAMVTDSNLSTDVPVFKTDEIKTVADFIEDKFLKSRS